MLKYYEFYDLCSGGYACMEYTRVFIRAYDMQGAVEKFQLVYGFSPLGSSCDCCGADYSIKGVSIEYMVNELLEAWLNNEVERFDILN